MTARLSVINQPEAASDPLFLSVIRAACLLVVSWNNQATKDQQFLGNTCDPACLLESVFPQTQERSRGSLLAKAGESVRRSASEQIASKAEFIVAQEDARS